MSRKRKRPLTNGNGDIANSQKRVKKTPNVNKDNNNQHNGSSSQASKTTVPIDSTEQLHHHPLLSRYYKQVVSLRSFLLSSLPSSSKSRRRKIASIGLPTSGNTPKENDGQKPSSSPNANTSNTNGINGSNLAHLLDTTLIGILKEPSQATTQTRHRDLASFTQSQARSTLQSTDTGATCPQSEIVDFVIYTLFHRTGNNNGNSTGYGNRPQHLLCHGFQRVGPRHGYGAAAGNIMGVVPQYPNQNVSVLRKGVWAEVLGLLGRSGEEVMMRMLLDCGIFLCVDEGRGNYYQLSGIPLSDLEVVNDGQSTDGRRKEAGGKSIAKKGGTGPILHTPGNITFVRRRMLYARAVLNAKGEVRFGLRHKHVLNRCSDSSNLSQTVHIMKYIFPRQFGLHNVFTSRVDTRETVQPFKDYTLREDEIEAADRATCMKKGVGVTKEGDGGDGNAKNPLKTKLPKRLRGELVSLIQKLQKRHTRCAYSELLKYYCPIERTPTAAANNCFTEFATPVPSVSAFCRATILKLVPNELLYGVGEDAAHNKDHISKFIDTFIRMRRFESLSLHQVAQGMKVTCIKWLQPPQCNSGNISLSDLRKRTEIFQELLYYIFDSLLIPLIRSNFFVTESNNHRNRLFYFRHDVWRKLTEPTLTELKTSVFEEMRSDKAKHILNQRTLGFSQLRLLPKTTGARPITNLRRRVVVKKPGWRNGMLGPSINSLMTPVYNMLGYEKEQQSEKLGSAMFSVPDMYPRLKSFRQKLIPADGKKSPKQLFFVKLDIKSCFDTIPQHKLIQLVDQLVSEDEYRVTKHVEMKAPEGGIGKPTRKFITKARGAADLSSLLTTVSNGSSGSGTGKRHTVFVGTSMQKKHNTDELLGLLEEHVRMNLVKIGKKYYRQKNGIPQGSVLSSLLCNFFYGKLENEVLPFLHENANESLLLRLIDDFLLITTNRSHATRFLELMIAGQPDYGITINPKKSLVNFPATVNGIKIPRCATDPFFPYCGSLINTHTLEISREDRSSLLQPKKVHPSSSSTVLLPTTSDTLTISTSQSQGHSFHRKSLTSFRLMSSSPMFLDTSHNSEKVVCKAIYNNYLSAAMRMERYLHELKRSGCPVSVGLIVKTINDLVELGVKVVRARKGRGGFECSVGGSRIRGLGVEAFGKVFGRKQTGYREVVGWLRGVGTRKGTVLTLG
ncbi:hypothetical protein FQN54_006486 [Arachnomyces sp. PD_36]|nr:hypothetical protein FQN54_006486 [Arachnomyces sp. PD_36]